MTAALVITLREGMEAALVLGIILIYLQRTGRTLLNRYVYWGLGLAALVSLTAGIVIQQIGFDSEVLEGPFRLVAGIFVASMVLWMWHTSKNIRRDMESRIGGILAAEKTSRRAGLGLMAFAFFLVAREGVEMVILLAAATLGQGNGIFSVLGGLLGITVATLFAIFFIRGSLKLNLSRFFKVTTVILLILAAQLLGSSAHEFAERGILPMSRSVMQFLGYFVRDQAVSLIMMGLIAVPILMVLWDFRRATQTTPAADGTAAEQRKIRASRRMERIWQFSLVGTTLVIVLAIASQAFAASPFIDPAPQPVTPEDNEIRLPTADWEKGVLQKFSYSVSGAEVRFLAVKLDDGAIATALDACQICGIEGYMEEKDGNVVICKICNAPIPVNTMGQGGGCNPLPLSSRTDGTTLIIQQSDLEKQSQRFQEKEAH